MKAHSGTGMHAGIVEQGLAPVKRSVPHDEPPPWPSNQELSVVGRPTPRLDAREKVTGKARYTFDVQLPGMLYARCVVSTVPHARIKSIDTSAAASYPGVRAVHVLQRVLGIAQLRDPGSERDAYPRVRYVGQPIAAVAAVSARAARAAAELVRIDYEQLPHVVGLADAMQSGAPLVFEGPTEQPATAGGGAAPPGLEQHGNLRGPNLGASRGDIAAGFAAAEVIFEHEFHTQVQTHVPMETHGLVADWQEDGLTLYASTQYVLSVRDEAAQIFDLPRSRIRAISDFTGGGFGAKYGIGNYGMLAIHLSRAARAPVRLVLDRREEHVSAGNRPNSLQRIKLGAKRDGSLTAIQLESYGGGGAAAGAGVGFCHGAMYPCADFAAKHYDVFTNAGPCAAFRAPGQVQGIFALEQMLDELAERIGIDPVELRDRIDTRDTDDARARAMERRIGVQRFGWQARRAPGADTGPIKRGIGMAQSQWVYLVHKATHCEARVHGDGSVEVFSATQDIGTGTRTVIAQVVAEELGLQASDISVYIGDSRYPPGPPSGGSRVTSSVTPAARNAAYRLARAIAAEVAAQWGVAAKDVVFSAGHVVARGREQRVEFREAIKQAKIELLTQRAERVPDYEGYAREAGDFQISKHGIGGVQFVEISVDTETGKVQVLRVLAVHDCGRPINPKLVESQIYGGVIHGVSFALYEERHLDPTSGVQLNANIDQYKIVGARETPQIEVQLIEQLGRQSSTDARGVAEPANVATAAAIANAFYNATGRRIRTLPLTPANVLAALET